MRRGIATIILSCVCIILASQSGNLGLHGKVTWLSSTKVSVEYDWTDDSQLQDWTATDGSMLVRSSGTLSITGGSADVSSMIWRQPVKCTRLYAVNARAISSTVAHLNFMTNVSGWTGYNFNPEGMTGLLYSANGNYWLENGSSESLAAPQIQTGISYTIDINITSGTITARASSDNRIYSHELAAANEPDRQVAVGGWGGETSWGKIIIEGEVNTSWQPRTDMIDIVSCGSTFAPVIEVSGSPIVEWFFYDGTTSTSATPSKDYGTIGVRHNLLKVTPWSSLTGINAGYDAADGGYGQFAMIPAQNILEFQNLNLAASGLRYLCSNYSPLAEINFEGLTGLRFIELLKCSNLSKVTLGNHPYLERICLEDCNLETLDISGCTAVKDLRAASNNYKFVNWGNSGSVLWHICIRSNPAMDENIPALTKFPMLRELLIWDANQTGPFECHSNIIQSIQASGNNYSGLDISGCTSLNRLEMSGSRLTTVALGSAPALNIILLKDCVLSEQNVDYALATFDAGGVLNGTLDLSENFPPSAAGMVHYNSLKSKGWTVYITDPGQKIIVSSIILRGENGVTSITSDKGALRIIAEVSPLIATDPSLTWSVVYGSGLASVNNEGLLTAAGNGIVRVRAEANDGSAVYGEITISISNQTIENPEDNFNISKVIAGINELQVLFDNDFTNWTASIYNMKGNLMSRKTVEGDQVVFDISGYSAGIYLVVITRGDAVRVAEFVKP